MPPKPKKPKDAEELPMSSSKKRRQEKRAIMKEHEVLEFVPNRRRPNRWEEIHGMGATEAFKTIYGFNPEVHLFEQANYPALKVLFARNWWERAGVEQQCNNVIGEFRPGIECYICGFPIMDKPECEHVLPVFKAAMYLHLYRNGFKPLFDERMDVASVVDSNGATVGEPQLKQIKYELLLEYKWAHRCCNQVKSDTDFVKFKHRGSISGAFELDFASSTAMLTQIAKNVIADNKEICSDPDLKRRFYDSNIRDANSIKKWVNRRIDILNGKLSGGSKGTIRAIVDYLNGVDLPDGISSPIQQTDLPGLFMLSKLSKVILAANMDDVWRVTHRGQNIEYKKEMPMREIVTESKMISETALHISENFAFEFERNIKSVEMYDFYEKLFDLSKSNVSTTRIGRGVTYTLNHFKPVTMLSIQKKYETDANYKYFFMKMFSVLHYYGSSSFIERKDDASEIASKSYAILMILTYIKRIDVYIGTLPTSHPKIISYSEFRTKFVTALGTKLTQLFDSENAKEFENINNVRKFSHILRQFMGKIDPIYTDILNESMPQQLDDDEPQYKFDIDFDEPLTVAMVNYYLDNYEKENIFEDFEEGYSGDSDAPEIVTAKATAMASDVLLRIKSQTGNIDIEQTKKDILIGQIVHFLREDFIDLPKNKSKVTAHFTQIGKEIKKHVVPGDVVTPAYVDVLMSRLIDITTNPSGDLSHISDPTRTEIATILERFDMETLRQISDELSDNLESRLRSEEGAQARGGKSKKTHRTRKSNKHARKQTRKYTKK